MSTRHALVAAAALLFPAGTAFAQIMPQDPAVARALTEAQVNQQLQQTQLNTLQVQQNLQADEIRRQQQFNSLPPPAYMQPPYAPPVQK